MRENEGGRRNETWKESTDNILSIVKQRTGAFGDRPARPTLLEQVLNQKRLVSICKVVTNLLRKDFLINGKFRFRDFKHC